MVSLASLDTSENTLVAIERAQKLVEHEFVSQPILVEALTHSSFSNEKSDGFKDRGADNERLEFLGDAVIGLCVAQGLMDLFPRAPEGKLSKWRSALVSRKTLAEIAQECGIGEMILLGKGERRTGGEEKSSILAAAFEALVGALYLDAGLDKARIFLYRIYAKRLETLAEVGDKSFETLDRKTWLQEKTQRLYKTVPEYRLVESWGAEHAKNFRVEIYLEGKPVARGEGKSKKEAEQNAAAAALESLGI